MELLLKKHQIQNQHKFLVNFNMTKEREKKNFEDSIGRLEKLVENMESGESSLEQNLAWFEEGMKLIKICQGHLTDAEHRVQELVEKNGQIIETKNLK